MLDMLMNSLGGKQGIAKQLAPLLSDLGKHMEEKRQQYKLDRYYYVLGTELINNEHNLYLKYMVEKDNNRMVVTEGGKEKVYYGIDIIKNISGGSTQANMILMPLSGMLKKSLNGLASELALAKTNDANGLDYAFMIEHEEVNGNFEPYMITKADPYGKEVVCGKKLDKEGIVSMLLGFEPASINLADVR
jgi:hypothetical protein